MLTGTSNLKHLFFNFEEVRIGIMFRFTPNTISTKIYKIAPKFRLPLFPIWTFYLQISKYYE